MKNISSISHYFFFSSTVFIFPRKKFIRAISQESISLKEFRAIFIYFSFCVCVLKQCYPRGCLLFWRSDWGMKHIIKCSNCLNYSFAFICIRILHLLLCAVIEWNVARLLYIRWSVCFWYLPLSTQQNMNNNNNKRKKMPLSCYHFYFYLGMRSFCEATATAAAQICQYCFCFLTIGLGCLMHCACSFVWLNLQLKVRHKLLMHFEIFCCYPIFISSHTFFSSSYFFFFSFDDFIFYFHCDCILFRLITVLE